MGRFIWFLLLVFFTAAPQALAQPTLNTLVNFNSTNGAYPQGALLADTAGNLYGTTAGGGTGLDGTVFEIDANTHALTTLVNFNGTNGTNPISTLIADAAGNFYGTTASNAGTVFEVAANTHTLTTLVTFSYTNGSGPAGALLADAAGNLYGTTQLGGNTSNQAIAGYGTVFEVDANTHALTTLVKFNVTNGANPVLGTLIADAAGNLYGTTKYGTGGFGGGGSPGDGTVFEVAANTHTLTTLATFNFTDGANPEGGLLADAAGNLSRPPFCPNSDV